MSGTSTVCAAPPFMNTDIGGIGVRLSFYLQTIFLAALSARSEKLEEITGALYTLIATNMALAVTSLIMGLRQEPEMSFHDGLVVFYLLALSWVTVFCSLPSCHRFPTGAKTLKLLSVVQTYLVFVFALVILIKAKKFGSSPECNPQAVVVLFRPFSALDAGRVVGWIVTVAVIAMYTVMTAFEYSPPPSKKFQQWVLRRRVQKDPPEPEIPPNRDLESDEHVETLPMKGTPIRGSSRRVQPIVVPTYDLQIAGDLIVELIVVVVLWAMTVMNTELLILWNHFKPDPSARSPWQFGQVLPMFLVVLPLSNMVGTFKDYGLKPRRHLTFIQRRMAS